MINKFVLDNGIRVVCEQIPYLRSITIGIWVGTGSRNESKINNGISHFIEHMLFKGTENRTAKDIAASIDNIGGHINAFTGKEYTCYYAKTLDTHIDVAIEVLADMFFNSLFNDKDINLERKVILEEINMYQDTPEDLVHGVMAETMWGGDPLGYTILGTPESLQNINSSTIREYLDEFYLSNNIVIAVAGNYEEKEMLDILSKFFGSWQSNTLKPPINKSVAYTPGIGSRNKDTEQIHSCIGFQAIEYGNDDVYPLLLINNILGGGMSSRLFQKIREEMGLVYTIYSYPSSFKNIGAFSIYAGMNPEQFEQVTKLTMLEIKQFLNEGVSQSEMEKSKEQLKGNYMLGLESTNSRMTSMGKSQLLLGEIRTPDEVLDKIEKINAEDIDRIIKQVFDLEKISLAAVGRIKEGTDLASYIEIWFF